MLFSPIGTTDPVRDFYDGPMLHIVRHYKPCKVYLYFTKEMSKNEENILDALKYFDIEIRSIITEIEDPHNYDIFAKEFDSELSQIFSENEASKILVNISSGTPQMKSALCLEVVSSDLYLKPIQVLSPAKAANLDMPHGGNVRENLDNIMEKGKYIAPNRCIEPNILSFRRFSLKRDLTALIKCYEYRAAYEKIKINKHLFDEKVLSLVHYAMLRQNDNPDHKKSFWHNEYNYTKDTVAGMACDYYCILNNKASIGELSYFVLLLKNLAEYVARHYIGGFREEEAKIILDIYYKEKSKESGKNEEGYRPYRAKINNRWETVYNLEQYIAIMVAKNKSLEDISRFNILQKEIESRNILAHDLYREETINPDISLKALKYLLKRTFQKKIKDPSLSLYENINKKIVSLF